MTHGADSTPAPTPDTHVHVAHHVVHHEPAHHHVQHTHHPPHRHEPPHKHKPSPDPDCPAEAPPPYYDNSYVTQSNDPTRPLLTETTTTQTDCTNPLAYIVRTLFGVFTVFIFIIILSKFVSSSHRDPWSTGPGNIDWAYKTKAATGDLKSIPSDSPAQQSVNPLSSERKQIQHKTFEPISGHFDLYDLLELTTVTGAIDITVNPQPGSAPAVLKIQSATGSVTVRLASIFIDAIASTAHPDHPREVDSIANASTRMFETHIETNTGAIVATYILGNGGRTRVVSQTGAQNLLFYAMGMGEDDPVTELETLTEPGSQNIDIWPSELCGTFRCDERILRLRAEHKARGFGGVNVRYPQAWEGRVEAVLQGVGSVDVGGEGVVVDIEEPWLLKAHKGDEKELVRLVGQGSGALQFKV